MNTSCWRRQYLDTQWRNSVMTDWRSWASMVLTVNGAFVE